MTTGDEGNAALERRRLLINQIQEKRKSKVICYLTGDRQNLETRIAARLPSFDIQSPAPNRGIK